MEAHSALHLAHMVHTSATRQLLKPGTCKHPCTNVRAHVPVCSSERARRGSSKRALPIAADSSFSSSCLQPCTQMPTDATSHAHACMPQPPLA